VVSGVEDSDIKVNIGDFIKQGDTNRCPNNKDTDSRSTKNLDLYYTCNLISLNPHHLNSFYPQQCQQTILTSFAYENMASKLYITNYICIKCALN